MGIEPTSEVRERTKRPDFPSLGHVELRPDPCGFNSIRLSTRDAVLKVLQNSPLESVI
jgi:hypothetical protein